MPSLTPQIAQQGVVLTDRQFKGSEDGASVDRTLADLRLANVARAIAEGGLGSAWQLGVVIGDLLTRREGHQ